MTTATETQPTTAKTRRKRMESAKAAFDEQLVKMKQDEQARGLWCICGHSTHDHDCGHTCQQVACKCLVFTPCNRVEKPVETQPAISLSNFRVTYQAPHYEDGQVLYDGYCAILADDAALDGAEVRVFDVPDVDEGQLAAAMFACDAMNQHARLIEALDLARKMFDYIIELPQIEQAQTQAEQGTRMIRDFLADLKTTTSK